MLWVISLSGALRAAIPHLNASYVMVHLACRSQAGSADLFKYILCYGSSKFQGSWSKFLCVFKYILCYGSSCIFFLTTHIYCHLNTSYVMVHHATGGLLFLFLAFKYILCYGSSPIAMYIRATRHNLNTSYVMVHQENPVKTLYITKFKYILCYGSSNGVIEMRKEWF